MSDAMNVAVHDPAAINVAVQELCAQLDRPQAFVSILTLIERAAAARLNREKLAWEIFLHKRYTYGTDAAFEAADWWIAEVERQRAAFVEETKQ